MSSSIKSLDVRARPVLTVLTAAACALTLGSVCPLVQSGLGLSFITFDCMCSRAPLRVAFPMLIAASHLLCRGCRLDYRQPARCESGPSEANMSIAADPAPVPADALVECGQHGRRLCLGLRALLGDILFGRLRLMVLALLGLGERTCRRRSSATADGLLSLLLLFLFLLLHPSMAVRQHGTHLQLFEDPDQRCDAERDVSEHTPTSDRRPCSRLTEVFPLRLPPARTSSTRRSI
jgi:hypothetical protein